MIRMEYPQVNLDGFPEQEKVIALKKQVDMLTYNLQIVLNSIEDDLQDTVNNSGGSGGGGSIVPTPIAPTNYDDLSNKPKIKGITLEGDKSFSELGLYDDPDLVTLSNIEIQNLIDSSI